MASLVGAHQYPSAHPVAASPPTISLFDAEEQVYAASAFALSTTVQAVQLALTLPVPGVKKLPEAHVPVSQNFKPVALHVRQVKFEPESDVHSAHGLSQPVGLQTGVPVYPDALHTHVPVPDSWPVPAHVL